MALVCHCVPTRDRTVTALAVDGAVTVDEIGAACGAGTGCGGCHGAIEALLCGARLHLDDADAA